MHKLKHMRMQKCVYACNTLYTHVPVRVCVWMKDIYANIHTDTDTSTAPFFVKQYEGARTAHVAICRKHLCVCVQRFCMYLSIYACICMLECWCTCKFAATHVCVCVPKHACPHTHTLTIENMHACVCVYAYAILCTHAWNTCMHIYIHTDTKHSFSS